MPGRWTAEGLLDFLVTRAGLPQADRPGSLDVTFADIGLDSLAYLQLQAEVQGLFGVELPAEPPPEFTLGQILTAVNSHPGSAGDGVTAGADIGTADLVGDAGGPGGHTDNSVWIDADVDVVWAVTNDLESWPELFTEYASVEILEKRENAFTFRLTMRPDENGKVWSWVSERVLDPAGRRVRARRVETGPFEYMHIEWTYTPERGGTRMRWVQDFRMRPTAPLDDEAMTGRINTNTRREMGVIKVKVEAAAGTARSLPAEPPGGAR
jgi:aromatase